MTSKQSSFGSYSSTPHIISLDWRDFEHRKAAAKLAIELLPDSPASILGYDYLVNFHFLHLVRDGLIECDLYKQGGEFVAFLASTTQPFTFMKIGMKNNFLPLIYLTMKSLLLNPLRILAVLNVMKQDTWRRGTTLNNTMGEVLSFGVLEKYRSVIDPYTKEKISCSLISKVLSNLKSKGKKEVLVVVSKDNKRALTFYSKFGAVIQEMAYISNLCKILIIPLY